MAVGRFQVMALLQAARAHILGLPLESAYSWGLNRAIFYAAAKKGFKKAMPAPKLEDLFPQKRKEEIEELRKGFGVYHLGDEMAYSVEINGKLLFTIGKEIQDEKAFKKQIASRFGDFFSQAWEEALNICRQYDKGVLLSQRYFYETVYKPRRDELAKKWTELVSGKSSAESST
ncbi:hypothetical protein H5T87_04610 [bacterium]|nr:hypothetical protein [bacterium]